ncbi:MAG: LptF/LptG family permease [Planctomycetota bacterium]
MTLDRYVGRAVLGSLLASLVFFVFLTILLDLLSNLGRYLDIADREDLGMFGLFWFLAGYYLRMTPFSFVSIAPFVTVIGSMFAIARLMSQNELQPMLFVGRSMSRVLRPTLVAGGVMALGMAACWQWVMPNIAADVTAAQTFLSGGQRAIRNLVLEQRGESFVGLQVAEYDPEARRMIGVAMLRVGAEPGDASLIRGSAAQWDDDKGDWRLEDGVRRTGASDRPCAFLGAPEWPPRLVLQRGQENVPVELFSYDELLATRAERPNRKDVAMALHRHITYPLANLILLLLALPFAIHFERGSRIERVLSAIGVCVAYLLFDLTCQNLGYNGWLHPIVAAWSPTILFGSLGVVMFGSVRS